ncbi:MAG: exo-alpha-sialidase, partial [Planctomycetes bacterium]|nr:exo-alpha-sialidase [Planctomycetota bacterium]
MIRVGVRGVGVGYCTFSLLVVFFGSPEAEAGTEPAGLSVSQTVLRIARSTDGRHFEDTGKVFARHAAAPDLLKLPDGGLLALFDYAGDGDGAVRMVVSASPNKGKRWTAPNPITITDEKGRTFSGRRGAWFRGPGGSLRLVFSSPLSPRARSGGTSKNGSVGVWCATTRDGLNYRVEARADVIARGRGEVHPMAAVIDGRVHLYLASAHGDDSGTSGRSGAVRHFASDDGSSFERLGATRMPGVGNLVALEDEHKAFVSGKKGIISLRANDQHHWRAEPGIRLEGGWDPAVVRLDDGSYLMLYCTRLEDDADSAAQLVAPNMVASHSAQDWQVGFSASELSSAGPDGDGAGGEESGSANSAATDGGVGAGRGSQESTSGAKGAS